MTTNHRHLPRKKRSPSFRDQAIFLASRTQGRTQAEIAADNNLSQSRIAQILRRVERWSANPLPPPVGCVKRSATHHEPLTVDEHRRLEWHLCRERSQSLYDRALRAFDRAKDELKSVREGHRDHKPFQETVTREVNKSAQFLRVAQRANADLAKLAMSEPPPQPAPHADESQLERLMFARLNQARAAAEAEGKVAKSTENLDVVEHWYAALIGDRDYFESNPASLAPDDPLGQLAQFFHHPSWDTAEGEAPAEPRSSVPGSALEPHCPEAPASCSAQGSDTFNSDPETLTPYSVPSTQYSPSSPTSDNLPSYTPSNSSTPASNSIPPEQFTTSTPTITSLAIPTFDIRPTTFDTPPSPKSKNQKPKPKTSSLHPEPRTLNPYTRRLAHDRKLAQLAEFRRRGLPCMFEFDQSDGPLPPTYHQLDGVETNGGYITISP